MSTWDDRNKVLACPWRHPPVYDSVSHTANQKPASLADQAPCGDEVASFSVDTYVCLVRSELCTLGSQLPPPARCYACLL